MALDAWDRDLDLPEGSGDSTSGSEAEVTVCRVPQKPDAFVS